MYTVWSMKDCVWCIRVCELLADRGIPFEKHEPPLVELRPLMLARGFRTLPQVFDGDRHIGGYQDVARHLGGHHPYAE